jgi:hypothetical protein
MVDIVNPVYSLPSNQQFVPFEDSTANGMPPISQNMRKINPLIDVSNSNQYDKNRRPEKRYHPFNAPSAGSPAESFLKSRYNFSPVFMHNEAMTRYSMISAMSVTSSDIKHKEIRFV